MEQGGKKRRERRAGYSLVEVTLALLVVAIGLTATFALFPEGLRATRAAVDDTEIALFAEYVFTVLDLTAGKYGGNYGVAPPKGWMIENTDDFISLMLSEDAALQSKFQLKDGGGLETFYWIPNYFGLSTGDYDSTYFKGYWTSAFTYTLELRVCTWKGAGTGVPTYALLKVWPGEHLDGDPQGEPRVFYREILPVR